MGTFPLLIVHSSQNIFPELALTRPQQKPITIITIIISYTKKKNRISLLWFSFNKSKITLRHSVVFNRLKICPVSSKRSLGSFLYIPGQKSFLSIERTLWTSTLTCKRQLPLPSKSGEASH